MESLGVVIQTTGDNSLIIKSTHAQIPNKIIGKQAITKRNKEIGKVTDVFGPVDKPYIFIQPHKNITPNEISGLKGTKVYTKGRRTRS